MKIESAKVRWLEMKCISGLQREHCKWSASQFSFLTGGYMIMIMMRVVVMMMIVVKSLIGDYTKYLKVVSVNLES